MGYFLCASVRTCVLTPASCGADHIPSLADDEAASDWVVTSRDAARGAHLQAVIDRILSSLVLTSFPSPVQSETSCVLASFSALARALTQRVQGTSAFLFGWADVPLQRGLAQRRKEMGWFKKSPDLRSTTPDVGPQPRERLGLTGASQL